MESMFLIGQWLFLIYMSLVLVKFVLGVKTLPLQRRAYIYKAQSEYADEDAVIMASSHPLSFYIGIGIGIFISSLVYTVPMILRHPGQFFRSDTEEEVVHHVIYGKWG